MPSALPEPAPPRLNAALDLTRLLPVALGRPLEDRDRIAVAVSGGGDSLALLLLAAAGFPGRVAALTVDHGLRAAAAAEAEMVAGHAARLDVRHVTLPWVGPKHGSNLQAQARAARYRLMGEWCAANGVSLLLTGHHADDQAETLLMRLQRGSGSAGMAGIRVVRPLPAGVTLVRPLLGVRRADLAGLVAAAGLVAIDDPSNRDMRFDRSAARALLTATPTLDVPRLAAVAGHLAMAEAALAWAADRAWAGAAVVEAGQIALDVAGLPDELVQRLLSRAIALLAPQAAPRGSAVAAARARLAAGGTVTLAGIRARGGAVWHFSRAAARRKVS